MLTRRCLMQSAFILLVTVVAAAILAVHPRLAHARLWKATITPLAFIIGSGFLVLGPILEDCLRPLCTCYHAGTCVGAYLFGSAIRFNMSVIDQEDRKRTLIEVRFEMLSSWVLAFAYIISVAYYLNLFGAFGVSLTTVDDAFSARILSSAIFPLDPLDRLVARLCIVQAFEQVAVDAKLAIIAGLLFGLGISSSDERGMASFLQSAIRDRLERCHVGFRPDRHRSRGSRHLAIWAKPMTCAPAFAPCSWPKASRPSST